MRAHRPLMQSPPVASYSLTDQASWAQVTRHARCAGSDLDPDQWFPLSAEAGKARQEAAAAIAICTACLVRGQCLALSLRHWDIGQHGVWGGLVPADRAQIRYRTGPDRDRRNRIAGDRAARACAAWAGRQARPEPATERDLRLSRPERRRQDRHVADAEAAAAGRRRAVVTGDDDHTGERKKRYGNSEPRPVRPKKILKQRAAPDRRS
jgi:hypothetical protein